MSEPIARALSVAKHIPWNVAVPVATAIGAYLNARLNVKDDILSLYRLTSFTRICASLEAKDRVNVFYRFEDIATQTESADRLFLVLHPESVSPGERTQWTYAEAYHCVLQWADWLQSTHSVQKGDIVALDCLNKPKFIWIWFALWSLGAMPAFINTNLKAKPFLHCVRTASTRLLLLDSDLSDILDDNTRLGLAMESTGITVQISMLDDDLDRQVASRSPLRAPDEARSGMNASTPSLLIYTSGTTGMPKAAKVEWRKPLSGIAAWHKLLQMGPQDRFFTAMPLYHSSATVLGVCTVVGAGCTLVLGPKFSPRTYIRYARETNSTVIQYIGEMCRYALAVPPSRDDRDHSIRAAFGNGLRPDVWQKFKDRFGIQTIVEFYGATEGPGISINVSRNDFSRGAIGRSGALMDLLSTRRKCLVRHDIETDAPLRDPVTNFCTHCGAGEPGELLHRLQPDAVRDGFPGYHGNETATEGKVLRDAFEKGDVWYRSGDLLVQDHDGRLWFVDRIGDTFRWKGENVSTAEVSEVLGSHTGISEANAYGVQLPGHDGRAGCAAIMLREQQPLDHTFHRELASFLRERLPRYAVPLFLRLVKELEVTGTMKQTKVGLRNEGVDPTKVAEDQLLWLPPSSESYERFGEKQWMDLTSGRVKL